MDFNNYINTLLNEATSKTNEAWWGHDEIDEPETVIAPDLDSEEGQRLLGNKDTRFPKGADSQWRDTPKPKDIDKDTEWLGDLEIDAEIEPKDDIKSLQKSAGIEKQKPDWELHPDWYWRDSSGKVVKDRWGNPVKSGSHPDSQKKQPWDIWG